MNILILIYFLYHTVEFVQILLNGSPSIGAFKKTEVIYLHFVCAWGSEYLARMLARPRHTRVTALSRIQLCETGLRGSRIAISHFNATSKTYLRNDTKIQTVTKKL